MATTKKTVLITGSTRSIGLAFAEYYTKQGWNVIGTTRPNSNTDQLMALSPFKTVMLETSDEASVLEAAHQLEGVPIDLLINNAGIYIEDDFKTTTKDAFMSQFEVNAVGPFLLSRALLPNLELAVKTHGTATVAQVSSFLGSIGGNTKEMAHFFSHSYAYSTSKAALNMVTRSMSVGLHDSNIIFVTLNPGYVATDMNGHKGSLKASDSAEWMAEVVGNLSMEDSGKFYNADKTFGGLDLPCTRSIGLAFAEYYTKQGWNVIGTTRPNSNTDQLMALSPFRTVMLETSDEASVLEAARQLEGVPIDLLINNAGIYIEDDFKTTTKDAFMSQFEVNAVGPFLLSRALLPNLELAVKTHGTATVAQVSSFLGSIGGNTKEMAHFFSHSYAYSTSKAALNMVTRSMSVGLHDSNIIFVTLNPGYVATDMNGHKGSLKASDSAEWMAEVVGNLSMEDSGKFYNADKTFGGLDLPW
ncbi:C-factor [Phytophthora citrophthora]|uniref:C-factor n=1 Tax=Phytophthora citrophthora TaxID=4793 RepID=A0AAD9FYW7_9STRA|nr:C-factor [Phytophthora citrophthora]